MATLLVVDDQPDTALVTSAILEGAGYTVVTTHSSLDAVDHAIANQPDLILLDVVMPDLSGWDVLDLLRQHPHTVGIPVVMISALSDASHRVRSLRAGASDFLVKPLDGEELLARIDRLLRPGLREDAGLRGRLDAHPLSELLQSLEQHRRTGRVQLRIGSRVGHLVIENGQVTHADFANLDRNEAVWALLEAEEGTFFFTAGLEDSGRGREEAFGVPLQGLLLEGAWVEDELAQRKHLLPPLGAVLEIVGQAEALPPEFAELPCEPILEAIRRAGKITLERLLDGLPFAPRRSKLVIAVLIENGLLGIGTGVSETLPERHAFDARCFLDSEDRCPDRLVSIAILVAPAALDTVHRFLAGLPVLSRATEGSRTETFEVESEGWRVRVLVCPLELDRVFEVFRTAAAAEAVQVWLEPTASQSPIPLRLIQAAAGPQTRLELFRAGDAPLAMPARQDTPTARWSITHVQPTGLADLVESLFLSGRPQASVAES